jgi:hypothetical protein
MGPPSTYNTDVIMGSPLNYGEYMTQLSRHTNHTHGDQDRRTQGIPPSHDRGRSGTARSARLAISAVPQRPILRHRRYGVPVTRISPLSRPRRPDTPFPTVRFIDPVVDQLPPLVPGSGVHKSELGEWRYEKNNHSLGRVSPHHRGSVGVASEISTTALS